MRRRLWYTICLLDSHLSVDRSTEPLLCPKLQPMLPLNIDDDDFGPNFACEESEGFTDMSLALLQYRIQALKSLAQEHPAQVAVKVSQLESKTKQMLQHCDPNSSVFAWVAYRGSLSILAGLQLYIKRPMHPVVQMNAAMEPESTNVLRLAVTMLEYDILKRTDPRGEPFRWFGMVLWHPLAVAIAECHACENVALLRHVWPTIESSFEYHSDALAKGTVWRPLVQLMLRTRTRVKARLDETGLSPSSTMNVATAAASVDQMDSDEQANNILDDWPLDLHFDESLWDMATPSVLQLGEETWDEFVSQYNLDAMGI